MKCRSQGTSTSQLMSNQELLSCKYLFPRTHFHSQYQEDSTITNEYLVFLDTILKLRLGFGVTSQHSHLFYHAITLCFSKAYMNSVTVFFPGTTLNLKAKIKKKIIVCLCNYCNSNLILGSSLQRGSGRILMVNARQKTMIAVVDSRKQMAEKLLLSCDLSSQRFI